jgi:uncharacterized protein (TIGR00369 family)
VKRETFVVREPALSGVSSNAWFPKGTNEGSLVPPPLALGGDPALPPRRVSQSQARLSIAMGADQVNPMGVVHGGMIMKLADEAATIAAIKHARNICMTVAIDAMTFLAPVHAGDVLTLNASVNWTGRTSIQVGVRVEAENILTGQVTHTNSAYLVLVALDAAGKPTPVPPLFVETALERRRWKQGAARRAQAG